MAYTMTANEALINRSVQDIIDAHENWGWLTPLDTMRKDRKKLEPLKTEVNARLTGSKKDYAIATIDALWNAWRSWNDRGWKTLQGKMIAGLQKIQAVLASSPEIVTNEITKIVTEYAPAPVTTAPVTVPATIPVKKGLLGIPVWGWVVIGVSSLGLIGYIAYKKIRK